MTEENTQDQQRESAQQEETTEESAGQEQQGAQSESEGEQQQEESTEDETSDSSAEAGEEAASESSSEEKGADEGEEVEVPEKFQSLVEQIEQMSVLDLNELVKVLEKKFGVSAAAAAAPAGGAAEGGEEAEEQTLFNVELSSVGDQKVSVIKVIKEVLGLGLKEAKEFAENAPQAIKEGVSKEEADEIKGKIEEAGGQVEIK